MQPPMAMVGQAYSTDLTFWMPAAFTDPGTQLSVDLEQLVITGITGVPLGLAIETNDPLGVYYPQQDQYGCARICGTPLGAGTYTITINILATVSVGGFQLNVPETFSVVLEVLPGNGANVSFSYGPTSGCGDVTSSFAALIDGSPLPTTYLWDLGNGNTSTLATPPPQTYSGPGTYVISLNTEIGGHVLDQVSLLGVNDNWCGDVEEPNIPLLGCTGSPDLYFVLTDGNGNSFTSSSGSNSGSEVWSGLGLVLSNPPYSIAFYDEDPISQDDHLGTYNITLNGPGNIPFNIASGTFGSLDIVLMPQQTFFDTDTVTVHPVPLPGLLQDTVASTICIADTTVQNVVWYLNGDTIPGATANCVNATMPGAYQAFLMNGYGCGIWSDTVVVCPEVEILNDANILYVDGDLESYSWYFNGDPIPGADDPFLFTQGTGQYGVTVTTATGCTVYAEFMFVNVGIPPVEVESFDLFPNPNDGRFTITLPSDLANNATRVHVLDPAGRYLYGETWTEPGTQKLMHLALPAGMYVVHLVAGTHRITRRMVVR